MNSATAFQEHRPLIRHIVKCFVRRYGGDREDIEAQANLAFVKAVEDWDPSRGPLSKRLGYVVWRRLLEGRRKERRRPVAPLTFDVPDRRGFDPRRLLREVGEEAGLVLRLIFDDATVLLEMTKTPRKNKPSWRAYRRGLVRVLAAAGWTAAETARAFAEIKECL